MPCPGQFRFIDRTLLDHFSHVLSLTVVTLEEEEKRFISNNNYIFHTNKTNSSVLIVH